MGHASHDALARVMRRRVTGGGHVTQRDAERVRDETSGIGPGPSGCRDGVRTGMERVITPPLHSCFLPSCPLLSCVGPHAALHAMV